MGIEKRKYWSDFAQRDIKYYRVICDRCLQKEDLPAGYNREDGVKHLVKFWNWQTKGNQIICYDCKENK